MQSAKTRLINYNGSIVEATVALFAADDRLVRYGDGLFESIRALNGKIPFWQNHYARLCKGAEALQMQMPESLTAEAFHQALLYLLQTNSMQNARMRLMLFRNGKGFYGPDSNETGYIMEAVESTENIYVLNPSGLRTGIYTGNYKSCTPFSNFKTNNSLLFVLAAIYRQAQQLDECFLINQKGLIAEAISSNVFIVKNEKLITPAPHQGCILGVMRSVILQVAEKEKIPFWEGVIGIDDLLGADEIFLTNASMGIQWVQSLQDRIYGQRMSTRLCELLNKRVFDA